MSELVLENEKELPNGWVKTKLGLISIITSGSPAPQGKDFFENGAHPFVRVADMGKLNTVYLNDSQDHVNKLGSKKLKEFPKGSVLFTKSGASTHLNQKAILGMNSYVVSHIGIILPHEKISSEWVYYFLKTIDFRSLTHETIMPSLKLSEINDLEILLPPLNEQKRTVTKIEEIFSLIDYIVSVLDESEKKIYRYEQSILYSAFSGHLTSSWRNMHKLESVKKLLEKLKQTKIDTSNHSNHSYTIHSIPDNWCWTNLSQLKKFSLYGPRYSSSDYSDIGFAVLRTSDIDESGKVDFTKCPRLNLSEFEFEKYCCKPNDILFTRTGSIGTLAVFNDEIKAIPGAYLIQYRLEESVKNSSWYLYYFFKSPIGQKYLKLGGAGVGRANINAPTIESIPIPFPSLLEQEMIIRTLKKILMDTFYQKNYVKKNLNYLKLLKNSILKQAFEGKLVPQDPNDELAEILLENIKQEKQKIISQSKRGKKNDK